MLPSEIQWQSVEAGMGMAGDGTGAGGGGQKRGGFKTHFNPAYSCHCFKSSFPDRLLLALK